MAKVTVPVWLLFLITVTAMIVGVMSGRSEKLDSGVTKEA